MKNREKFAKEILDVACKGNHFGVTKAGEIISCPKTDCEKCLFNDDIDCDVSLEQWSESEYIEKPTITSKEKMFLDLILSKWTYLARDADEILYVFDSLPSKRINCWCIENMSLCNYYYVSKKLFGNMFDFIKCEDEKPWSIEDLKKLEVKDE